MINIEIRKSTSRLVLILALVVTLLLVWKIAGVRAAIGVFLVSILSALIPDFLSKLTEKSAAVVAAITTSLTTIASTLKFAKVVANSDPNNLLLRAALIAFASLGAVVTILAVRIARGELLVPDAKKLTAVATGIVTAIATLFVSISSIRN